MMRLFFSMAAAVIFGLPGWACRTTGAARSSVPSSPAAVVEFRLLRIDPASMWQLTAVPFHQVVLVELINDPTGTIDDGRLKLDLQFGTADTAPFLRRTTGGAVLDDTVLRPGTLLTVRSPLGKKTQCPTVISGADGSRPSSTGGTEDALACYEVDISKVSLVTDPDG